MGRTSRSFSWAGILSGFSKRNLEFESSHQPLSEDEVETSSSSDVPDYIVLQNLLEEYNSTSSSKTWRASARGSGTNQLAKSENSQLIEFLYNNYKRRKDERTHYLNLLSFIGFLFLYLMVLTLQLCTSTQYELTTSILDDIIPKDENGERTEVLSSREEVYQWLRDEVVTKIWTSPVCGDGICERPIEHEAFGRFGCRVDCGEVPTSPVHIVLSEAAKSSAEGEMPRVNVCHRHFMLSESSRLCWFSQDLSVPLASGSSSSSSSEDLELRLDIPDGEWELIIKGVGGTLGSLFGGLQVHQPQSDPGQPQGTNVGNDVSGQEGDNSGYAYTDSDTTDVSDQSYQVGSNGGSSRRLSSAPDLMGENSSQTVSPPSPVIPHHNVFWNSWVEEMTAESEVVLPTYEFCQVAFQRIVDSIPEICHSIWSDRICCPHFDEVMESNCFCTSVWKEGIGMGEILKGAMECPGTTLRQGGDCPILSPVLSLDDGRINEAACYHTFLNGFDDGFVQQYCWDTFDSSLCCPAITAVIEQNCWCSTTFAHMQTYLRMAMYSVAELCGFNVTEINCTIVDDRTRYIVPTASIFRQMDLVLTTLNTRALEAQKNRLLVTGQTDSFEGSFPEVCSPQYVPVDCNKALELLHYWCSWHGDECSDECGTILCSQAITESCSHVEVSVVTNPYVSSFVESSQYGAVEATFRELRAHNCWDSDLVAQMSRDYSQDGNMYNSGELMQASYSGECVQLNYACRTKAKTIRRSIMQCLQETNSPLLNSNDNLNAWQKYITDGGGVTLLCLLFEDRLTYERRENQTRVSLNMGCDQLIGTLRAESSMFNLMLAHENYDGDCVFHAHCPSGQFCGLTLTASGNTSCMDCSMCCAPPVGSGAYNGSEPGCGHCSCNLCSPGCTQDMLTNFKCDAECFTEECNWDGHACSYELTYSPDVECPSDQSWEFWSRVVVPKTNQSLSQAACCRTKDVHDEVVPFSVWGHTSTDHHSSSSSFNSSSNSSSSSSSTASLSMLQENLSGNSSFTRLIANTNKILAGALLRVRRFKKNDCLEGSRFAYLYSMCRGDEDTEPFGSDPVFQHGSSLYDANISAHRDDFYPNTEEYINEFGVPYGFHHHPIDNRDASYPVLLDVNLKASRARDWMTYLQEGNYLDDFTNIFAVELVTFNGNYGIFTYLKVHFTFRKSGRIVVSHTMQHLKASFYKHQYGMIQLGLELVLIGCIVLNWYTEIDEFKQSLRKTRSIFPYFRKFSNKMDILSLCLFICIILIWVLNVAVMCYFYDMRSDYPVYEDLLAKGHWLKLANDGSGLKELTDSMMLSAMMATMMDIYNLMNGLNILLMLGRLLKLMDFHPDVGMITRTMKEAGNDLINFMVLCLTLIVAYAMMGSFLFGSMIGRMSDPGRAMQTLLLAMVGEFEAFSQEMENSTGLTVISIYIFFWSYMLLVYLILLNALLAIIVSAMDVIKNADAHRESTHFFSEMTDVGFYYLSTSADTCKRRLMGLVAFLPGFRHIRPNPDRILNEDEILKEISRWVDQRSSAAKRGRHKRGSKLMASFVCDTPHDIYDDKVLRFGARALTLGALQKMLAAARQEAIVTDRLIPEGAEMAQENANLSLNLGEESLRESTSASIDVMEDGVPMEGMARGVLRQFGRDDDLVRKLIEKGITSDLKKKAVQKRIFDERWKRGVSDRISRVENVMDGVSDRVGRVEQVMESVLGTLQRLEGRFGGPPTESTPSVVGSEMPETLIRPAMSLDTGMGAISQGLFTVHEDVFDSLKNLEDFEKKIIEIETQGEESILHRMNTTEIERFENNPVFTDHSSLKEAAPDLWHDAEDINADITESSIEAL